MKQMEAEAESPAVFSYHLILCSKQSQEISRHRHPLTGDGHHYLNLRDGNMTGEEVPASTAELQPDFRFTTDEAAAPWNVSPQEWLRINQKHFDGFIVSALVFDSQNRILLVQRAAHDTMPLRWEPPGGALEPARDATILDGCARELWEESGLEAIRMRRCVPVRDETGREYMAIPALGRRNRIYGHFTFEVGVAEGDVRLDPKEHQDFVWATDEEVRAGRVGEKEIKLTTNMAKIIVLEGFRLRGEELKVEDNIHKGTASTV